MIETITQKIYQSLNEVKLDLYSNSNINVTIQDMCGLLKTNLNKFRKEYDDLDGEQFERKVAFSGYELLSSFKFNEIENEFIQQLCSTSISDYFERKEIGNVEFKKIVEGIVLNFKEKSESYKNELEHHYKKANDIAEKFIPYLPEQDLSKNSTILINWGEVSSKTVIFGKFDKGQKYINYIKQQDDLKTNSVECIKQFDARKKDVKFIALFCFNDNEIYKIVLNAQNLSMIERTNINIGKQVKKISIVDDRILNIYLNGFSEPEMMVFRNYNDAIYIENKITSANKRG